MTAKKKKKSKVNEAGNYTKPAMRKRLFSKIKAGSKGGKPGQWSARKKDGTVYTGATHKMPDGSLHSGKSHGKTSVKLFHFKDLSATAKKKAKSKSKK